jgi:UDP-2-acetamido-3-amino-2,3-dideoxy-glucuronate N-acetyltransferase
VQQADHEAGIAVFGCGPWGANHLRVFSELGALRVVCDIDPIRLAAVLVRYPTVETTTNPVEGFGWPDIDAGVLATPAVAHGAMALEALQHDKDVLVEKPMAIDLAEAAEMCDLAERSGRMLAVGHVLEYHPVVRKLDELVGGGELGQLRYLYANRLNFGRIRTEESVLWSFAPHDVAIIQRLLGKAPAEVCCQGASYLNPGVADVTLTSLTFEGGVRGHIYVSWIHPFKEHRFVAIGERRMAVFDDTAPWPEKLTLYDHEVEWVAGQIPVARKASGEVVPVDEAEPLEEQAKAFLASVQSRLPPLADGRSGLAVMKTLHSAQRSIELGGIPQRSGELDGTSYRHPTATVDSGATIGRGTKIWHHAHVMSDATIGRDCVLGQNVFIGRGVRIGDAVRIQNNVSVFEGIQIEDHVFVGPSVVFTNVKHPRAEVARRDQFERTLIRTGATLGANATIVCGVEVGEYAFVGAAAVVTNDVPDHALVLGSPARIVGWACRCGERLPGGDRVQCAACGRSYVVDASGAREV